MSNPGEGVAATATKESSLLKEIIVQIVCGVIAIGLYITSFIHTSRALGGAPDRNNTIREALPGIIAPGILAGLILFIGIALFILQADNINVIYGLLFLSVFSFTMSYIALAISAINR